MEELIREFEGKEFLRSLQFDKETLNEDECTVELSVSSEYPVLREFGYEILDHTEESIRWERLKAGAAVRDTHTGDQVGIIERAWIDPVTKKLRNQIRFSKNTERAKEICADVKDGIRKNVSIKYQIYKGVVDKEVNGIRYIRITDWEPIHVSMEPDGADPTVGVTRDLEVKSSGDEKLLNEIKKIVNEEINNKITIQKERSTMGNQVTLNERELQEKERVETIDMIVREFKGEVKDVNLVEEGEKFKKLFRSAQDFSNLVFELTSKKVQAIAKPSVDLNNKEGRSYSIINAINYMINPRANNNCLEAEVSRDMEAVFGSKPSGLWIPTSQLKRDLTAGGAGTGAELVPTVLYDDEYIAHLKNETAAGQLGVRMMMGVGEVKFPKLLTGTTPNWKAGNTATDESTPTTGTVSFSPNRVGTYVDIDKTLLKQTRLSAQAIISQDLQDSVDVAIDAAMFHGTGTEQILGLDGIASIGTITSNGASLSWADALSIAAKVKIAKASKLGSMGFAFNPSVEAELKARPRETGYPVYVMGDDGKIGGYNALVTNQVNDANMFFGVWNQGIYVFWDGLDLTVDNITLAKEHMIRLVVNQLCDFNVRHAGAFVKVTGFS